MPKKKAGRKNLSEKKTSEVKIGETAVDLDRLFAGRVKLSAIGTVDLDKLLTAPVKLSGISAVSPIASAFISRPAYGVATLSPSEFSITVSREQELENEIIALRKENRGLVREIGAKAETEEKREKEINDLQRNIQALEKKEMLHHLLYRVNESARKKLLESEEFRNRFEDSESCMAVIMSVDIRRSTELMLRARKPELYADFISGLCGELTSIILYNYGVFDKFTGDGILAFFPDFYSGKDAPYLAMKAADECHNCFTKRYQEERSCFTSILMDVGLGIGIDYGESHLIKMQDGLTVIGTPVVYACRMSGATAGQTLLNQPAYEVTSQQFGEYVHFQESEIDIKHEGRTLAYVATLSKTTSEPELPDWLSPSESPKS